MRIAGKPARQVVGSSCRAARGAWVVASMAASLTVSIVGCSSPPSGGTQKSPSTESRGVQAVDSGTTSGPTNPYGVPYPTANLGTQARTGTVAGNVIENYKFLGFPNATPGSLTKDTGALQDISLADYFDPKNKKYKLLHISVAAVWCNPCNQETDELIGDVASLAQEGVVLIQALDDGPIEGVGATLGNLTQWIANKGVDYTMVLDPGNNNLGVFFDAAAIPWNANIDVRTMEILSAGVGYDGTEKADIQTWVDWVGSNPPSKE
jgi:hypothetical protein